MSSTNRSKARDNHISDYYVTPVNSITDFIVEFEKDYGRLGNVLLDPCAGGDSAHPMSYPIALSTAGYTNITTLDLRADSLASMVGVNYLSFDINTLPTIPDCIITNPPFNQALEIIQKALDDVAPGGHVVMLLRLNFLGSKTRFPFWKNNMPMHCYIHSTRMKFMNTGGTDSIEYMHCVWKKGHQSQTLLSII